MAEVKIFETENGYITEDKKWHELHAYRKATRNEDGFLGHYYAETTIDYERGTYSNNCTTGFFSTADERYKGRRNALKILKEEIKPRKTR